MSEQLLLHILRVNEMAQPHRTERESRPVLRLLTHTFPISVGMSNSGVITHSLSLASPEASRSSLGRVMETISLSMVARATRREERQVPFIAFPPLAQTTPSDTARDGEGRPTEPDPLVIFEGIDDVCIIC